ncbi:MAG: two-component system response regulator LytT [Flavobacteriales bacterium]|jgi:two-component system response regulator LytT
MTIVIIEDEERAANFLERSIKQVSSEYEVQARLESVEEALVYFQQNPNPDVIISDIQLGDGLSFEIFQKLEIESPVIFTTAYDQYAIEAFRANGVDYLLKPYSNEDLEKALSKAKKMAAPSRNKLWAELSYGQSLKGGFKKRFIVKTGSKVVVVPTDDVVAVYSLQKGTWLYTSSQRSFDIDQTMESVLSQLDPTRFFQVNRSCIVAIDAQKEIYHWSTSRLKITLSGLEDLEIIVARERTKEFKEWLDQ